MAHDGDSRLFRCTIGLPSYPCGMDIVDDIYLLFFENLHQTSDFRKGEADMLRSNREGAGKFIHGSVSEFFFLRCIAKNRGAPYDMMSHLRQSSREPLG